MKPYDYIKDIKRLSEIVGFKVPLDGFLMAVFKRPLVDIAKFDESLMRAYSYKGSMNDFILEKFGQEALDLLDKNLEKR